MKLSELCPHSFKRLSPRTGQEHPGRSIIELCRSDDSGFCRETVALGRLTGAQMARAAGRYRLGSSRSGKAIFWMIDELGICRDGHVDGSGSGSQAWVSGMLRRREPGLLSFWHPDHCLFGLHLLDESPDASIAVVQDERSAVILSELYPGMLWMATAYPANLTERVLAPLAGHRVVLFPPADADGGTYLVWLETAGQARRRYGLYIDVSPFLEDHASPGQKDRGIDLAGYILET